MAGAYYARMDLRELVEVDSSTPVERDDLGGVRIRGVKLIGNESRNVNKDGTRNLYPQESLEAASSLYEGAPIYRGHDRTGRERNPSEKLGKVANVEAREGGLYGDVLLAPGDDANRAEWAAKHAPDLFAMSHHAEGLGRKDGDHCRIESIKRVKSVDLVCAGGTTKGLFEDYHMTTSTTSAAPATPSFGSQKTEPAAEAAPKAAAAVESVESETPAEPKVDETTELREQLAKLQEQFEELKAEKASTERRVGRERLLAESKIPSDRLDEVWLNTVFEAETDDQAKALIEDRRRLVFHQVPTGSAPSGEAAPKSDHDAFKAWIES